jgi:hypothetical protein
VTSRVAAALALFYCILFVRTAKLALRFSDSGSQLVVLIYPIWTGK